MNFITKKVIFAMNEKEILLKFVAKTHGLSETAAADLLYKTEGEGDDKKTSLKTDAIQTLLDKDKERVAGIKDSVDTTEIFNKAYNKAVSEERGKIEKKLTKTYGVETTQFKNLDELVSLIVDQSKASGKGDGLDDDKIKAHPLYLSLEKSKQEEIDAVKAEADESLKTLEGKFQRKETLATVKKLGLEYFDKLNPVLSEKKASNQRNEFASHFEKYDYQFSDGNDTDPVVIVDNKRLEDQHGNPVNLSGLTFQLAEPIFDFAVQGDKGSPGHAGQQTGEGVGRKVPANEDEYNKLIFEAKSAEERIEIAEAWEASQK